MTIARLGAVAAVLALVLAASVANAVCSADPVTGTNLYDLGSCNQTAVMACRTAGCTCLGGSTSSGECVLPGTKGCGAAQECLRTYFNCLADAASTYAEAGGDCGAWAMPLHTSLLGVAAGTEAWEDSDAYLSCAASSCDLVNSSVATPGDCTPRQLYVCFSPAAAYYRFTLSADFSSKATTTVAKAELLVAITSSLSTLLEKEVVVTSASTNDATLTAIFYISDAETTEVASKIKQTGRTAWLNALQTFFGATSLSQRQRSIVSMNTSVVNNTNLQMTLPGDFANIFTNDTAYNAVVEALQSDLTTLFGVPTFVTWLRQGSIIVGIAAQTTSSDPALTSGISTATSSTAWLTSTQTAIADAGVTTTLSPPDLIVTSESSSSWSASCGSYCAAAVTIGVLFAVVLAVIVGISVYKYKHAQPAAAAAAPPAGHEPAPVSSV